MTHPVRDPSHRGHRAAAAALGLLAVLAAAAAAAEGPNIVLMLADDQGWNGLSVEMAPGVAGSRSTTHHTPSLQRFAAQAMRFSAAYAPAPVCSPTRISLQTGRSPAALHWTKAAPAERGHRLLEPALVKAIAANETTIGEVLRKAGYATAHYGKWHIAGGGPGLHGYDAHDGDTGNEQAYAFTDPNPVDIFGMARRAEAFMAESRRAGRPFFVQLSWNALHAAENALAATRAKYAHLGDEKRGAVAAITEDLDTGVGMVLDAIDRLGLAGTTYVIYTSDNGGGGGGRRSGLSGGKGSLFEGGIRVPFILRGPGVAANSWCHVPIVGYDLFPTFCEWAGAPRAALPAGLEGGSIAGLAAGGGKGSVSRPSDDIVFHFPHYQSGHAPHSAIRTERLKLVKFYEDDTVRLYDMDEDPGEARDIATARPADAARLRARLESRLATLGAQLPTRNPQFDPANPAPEKPRGGKGGGDKGQKKPRKNPA
jgi:arylsulfatase A